MPKKEEAKLPKVSNKCDMDSKIEIEIPEPKKMPEHV